MNENASLSGEIITFYSYKGGTGRSMALVNVAYLLSKKVQPNEKILLIDWDLEAPGLHQFFREQFVSANNEQIDLPSEQKGLIDLFYEIKTRLQTSGNDDEIPEDFFHDLSIQNYLTKIGSSPLVLMPAGKFGDGLYSIRVNEFSWAEFFSTHPTIIPQFAEYLRENYRYVLIDSRTGYTDISGICTSIMPEKLVVAFTPNRQNLNGATELIKRAINYRKQSDDLRQLTIFPLPSRIESAENKLQKEWRFGDSEKKIDGYQKLFEDTLKEVYALNECNLTSYFDEIQIQYIPRYSYGEEISVLSERTEDRLSIARSFENFTNKIILSENPWEELESEYAAAESIHPEQSKAYTNQSQNSRNTTLRRLSAQIITILLAVGFIAIVSYALYNSSASPARYYLDILGLWALGGILIEPLKLILATLGNFTSRSFNALRKFSSSGQANILKISAEEIEFNTVKTIAKSIGEIKKSLVSLSASFLRQVTDSARDIEPTKQYQKAEHNNETYLVPVENSFTSVLTENEFNGQKIIGALIGFLALLAFLYSDAAQGAQTYALLFDENIPQWLNSIFIPLVMASAGTALILGLFIGDILGLTHLGLFNKDTPKPITWLIAINLIFSLILSSLIALSRMELLGADNKTIQLLANLSQSLAILPMLITTMLLYRGVVGIYAIASLVLLIFAIVFGVFEFIIRVLSDLLRLGTIGSVFIITRFTWLISKTIELLWLLLELITKGSFTFLTYVLAIIFFVPHMLFLLFLRIIRQENFYSDLLESILNNRVNTEIDKHL